MCCSTSEAELAGGRLPRGNRAVTVLLMEFRILGPLEALDGGKPLALGGRKRRAVLALLLLHPDETVGSERMVDELWGESAPAGTLKTPPGARLAAAQGAAGGRARHARPRLRAPDRARPARRAPLRAAARRGQGRAGRRPARARAGAARARAGAVARPAARRPRLRALRPGRDRAPRGPAAGGGRAADRGEARARPPRAR